MAKKIKKMNMIDLEATCWDNQTAPDGRPQNEVSEIIEIGIVQIDLRQMKISDKKSYLVKPKIFPELSDYCKNLTSITQEMIDKKGTTLEYAFERMKSEFKTMKYEWASWGDYDRIQIQRQCENENLQYPFHKTHLNMKFIMSFLVGSKIQRNVDGMMKFLHMDFEGHAHRGVDDAYNIARMFITMMNEFEQGVNENIFFDNWGDEFHKQNQ